MRNSFGTVGSEVYPNQRQDENNLPITEKQISENITKEVMEGIKNNINQKQAPAYYLITHEVLKQLPTKCRAKLTHLFNAAMCWKVAEVNHVTKTS